MDQRVGLGKIAARAKDRRAVAFCDAVDHEIDDIELGAVAASFAKFGKSRSGFFGGLDIEISYLNASFLQEAVYKSVAGC